MEMHDDSMLLQSNGGEKGLAYTASTLRWAASRNGGANTAAEAAQGQ